MVEDGRRISNEWKDKYESVKAEGKGVRQQVLEAVGYVVDIINITRERLQALVRANYYSSTYPCDCFCAYDCSVILYCCCHSSFILVFFYQTFEYPTDPLSHTHLTSPPSPSPLPFERP